MSHTYIHPTLTLYSVQLNSLILAGVLEQVSTEHFRVYEFTNCDQSFYINVPKNSHLLHQKHILYLKLRKFMGCSTENRGFMVIMKV